MSRKKDETAVTVTGPAAEEKKELVSQGGTSEPPVTPGPPTPPEPTPPEPPVPPAPPTQPEPVKTVRALFLTNCTHNHDRYQAGQKEDLPEDVFGLLVKAKAVQRLGE